MKARPSSDEPACTSTGRPSGGRATFSGPRTWKYFPTVEVVDQFVQLKMAGIDRLQLSFYDFKPDLEFFGRRVIPLMELAGLRFKVAPPAGAVAGGS